MRKFIVLLSIFLLTAGVGTAVELPDEARLSADRMRFDSKSGDFLATGNVVIKADGMTVHAPRGTGNVQRKEVHFTEGIVASGDWQGDWVDFKAGSITLLFGDQLLYIADKGVKGDIGKITVDADKLSMKGTELNAVNVRRLEDREAGIAFGADDIQGTLEDGILKTLTAKNKVWLRGRPNQGGEMVDIRGDTAVYSVERGSVVLSGNVKAVQKGRTLTSQSIVYFPANNRVEAIGGITGGGKTISPDRATITIDLKQEKIKQENKRNKK